MKFFIREWSENTIVLMTESGNVLSYFSNVEEALNACEKLYCGDLQEDKPEISVCYRQDVNDQGSAVA
ncbi:hypothetical protein MNBD_GAMMA10-1218 [hydrothermal vent metagenome]|uniref:Uncharacterized protein n=1 Tax=hydrothermal vent metagenome TaxID=652676 RepID=A0A3B0XCM5_9ZZZZ